MTILDRIVDVTRDELRMRKRQVSLDTLRDLGRRNRPTRSLAKALRADYGVSVIAEIKRASPSQGPLRAEVDVSSLAASYQASGAAAISVLTEEQHFKGSLQDLQDASYVVDVPILRKDFIVDEYQLLEARAHGADAVLLIAAVLDASELRDLQDAAAALGLECLVEIYQEQELDKLDWDRVTLLGVNNRDLRTFEVDIAHSIRLLKHCPRHVVRVSESGLSSPEHLVALRVAGIDAALIGTTFMRANDPAQTLGRLLEASRERTLEHAP